MSALTVATAEATVSESAKNEAKQMMQEGASDGSSVVAAIMSVGDFDSNGGKMHGLVESILLAVARMPLPSFTVATVPAAASNIGRQIYVTNGAAGGPIVAVSDGVFWRRSDTRTAISP